MATNVTRRRIEWHPGAAALEALEVGERVFPHLHRQEVIDKLVILGLWLAQQPVPRPPALDGRDRDSWKLPASLRLRAPESGEGFPEKSIGKPAPSEGEDRAHKENSRKAFPGETWPPIIATRDGG